MTWKYFKIKAKFTQIHIENKIDMLLLDPVVAVLYT